ncbi:MAG: hypothetical protein AAGJ79_05375 [Verrucomicrobiota bacterium]
MKWRLSVMCVVGWSVCAAPFSLALSISDEPEVAGGKLDVRTIDEESWLVSVIMEDLRRAAGRLTKETADRFEIRRLEGRKYQDARRDDVLIELEGPVWDPSAYGEIFSKLARKAERRELPERASILPLLVNPSVENLQKVNLKLSERLQLQPEDFVAHEQAALLQGIFALRENCGLWSDTRMALCRMTVHLVVADYLRGEKEASYDGAWAEFLLQFHLGKRTRALELLENLRKNAPDGNAYESWCNAAEVLITQDWRSGHGKEPPSAIEGMAYFRAYCGHVDADQAIPILREYEVLAETADGVRSVLNGRGFSVGVGHIANDFGLAYELKELGEVFDTPRGDRLFAKPEKLAEIVNVEPWCSMSDPEGKSFRVIDDGQWGLYFQRHFVHLAGLVVYWIERQLGLSAEEWEESLVPIVGKFSMGPLAMPYLRASQARYNKSLRQAGEFAKKRPYLVTFGLLQSFGWDRLEFERKVPLPEMEEWFTTILPPETLYSASSRLGFFDVRGIPLETLKEYSKSDPWNRTLAYRRYRVSGEGEAELVAAYGPILNYNASGMSKLAALHRPDEEKYIGTMQQLCEMRPYYFMQLGEYQLNRGKLEAAAESYEKAFARTTNTVALSHSSRFLVHSYLKNGEKKKARRLAKDMAFVYSYSGLETAMLFFIETGNLEKAQEKADAIEERYGDNSPQFVMRYHDPAGKLGLPLEAIFPEKPEKVKMKDFEPGEIPDGLRVDTTNEVTGLIGLRKGDVILALNGVRVRTIPQYQLVARSGLSPAVHYIVRRGEEIIELSGWAKNCRLRNNIEPTAGN